MLLIPRIGCSNIDMLYLHSETRSSSKIERKKKTRWRTLRDEETWFCSHFFSTKNVYIVEMVQIDFVSILTDETIILNKRGIGSVVPLHISQVKRSKFKVNQNTFIFFWN